MKLVVVDGAREVCGSVRRGGKNPRNEWWNDGVKLQFSGKRLHGRICWKQRIRL